MTPSSCLYVGQVFHRRTRPRVHAMRYRVFSLLLDLDEIDTVATRLWCFSRNRFNLFSFHDADFGSTPGEPLGDYVRRTLRENGIDSDVVRIRLACYPRILGYTFNPLSLFYCHDDSGRVVAVLHEVHNTFGERHAYALPAGGDGDWIHQKTDKALFVSPFNHMNMRYEFRLNEPGARQVVAIRVLDDAGHFLSASYVSERRPLESSQLLRLFLALPFMTVKVVAGIHWEALKLWIKRVPWFTHQPKNTQADKAADVSAARDVNQ